MQRIAVGHAVVAVAVRGPRVPDGVSSRGGAAGAAAAHQPRGRHHLRVAAGDLRLGRRSGELLAGGWESGARVATATASARMHTYTASAGACFAHAMPARPLHAPRPPSRLLHLASNNQGAAQQLDCQQKLVMALSVDGGDTSATSSLELGLACVGSPTGAWIGKR
jgi:hypothetical protein